MDDLQEQLSRARIEDEDSSIDGLCSQITLERFVNRDAVDVSIIDEKLDLITEELAVILRVQEFLIAFRGVKLKTFADTLPKHVQRRVSLHDLSHRLLNKCLQAREVLSVGRVEIVSEVNPNHQSSG